MTQTAPHYYFVAIPDGEVPIARIESMMIFELPARLIVPNIPRPGPIYAGMHEIIHLSTLEELKEKMNANQSETLGD